MTNENIAPSYDDFDRERFVREERSGVERRSEFARDRARVLHSSALRRLGAKTQVLEPAGGDFARTRLTHSLEVAQVGREMAQELNISADLVDMACLAHDLGHPPFGHNGEKALNDWASDIGGFEGNAQTLRLLTRLEPKVFTASGISVGLNLTRAALDATCKYPWTLEQAAEAQKSTDATKFGCYEDDKQVFDWLRAGRTGFERCIEAQVMDFADDVAYSVHDFEDAVVNGFINLEEVASPSQRGHLVNEIVSWSHSSVDAASAEAALSRIMMNPYWASSFDGTVSELGRLKNLTSSLIGSFVGRVTDATIAATDGSSLTRYSASVEETEDVQAEIAVLKGLVSAFLMSHESRRPFYEWQRALLKELADALLERQGAWLDSVHQAAWHEAMSHQEQKRVIVDQVASLTDQSALTLHDKLVTRGL
jgi:dGTPase